MQTLRIMLGRYELTDTNGLTVDHGTVEPQLADLLRKIDTDKPYQLIVEPFKNVPNPNR